MDQLYVVLRRRLSEQPAQVLVVWTDLRSLFSSLWCGRDCLVLSSVFVPLYHEW
ncbi:unnamed protein product [Cyberlindnera jadinii]|uniref:Uncharacterized protein n=1 Tax=Cyberlindnera jadinii (strain ATCC 18201 / CBS 1600 / BCRC 20928 / JCM 3617 / NBRC 0987 / NRRL Y-1542) TaxID=983966 RepID=A0A0H5C1P4_CYBJN|nr:unnamed protein product [Cyberlindnera jadinii]